MWLTGRLCPDFKTIADFRRDNGKGIRNVCRRFVALCRQLDLFSEAIVAIDGSKFKAVNNRDKNFTPHKLAQRMKQIDESIERYLQELDTADRTQSPDAGRRGQHIQEKLGKLRQQMEYLRQIEDQLKQQPDEQLSLTDPDARSMATSGRGTGMVGYNVQASVHGLAPLERSHSTPAGGIYTAEATRRTYALLHAAAAMVLDAGWSVVVDAAGLPQAPRAGQLPRPGRPSEVPISPSSPAAHRSTGCAARLETRQHDASEATVEVLERQLDWVEPLATDEAPLCIPMLDPEQGRRGPGGVSW